MQVVTETVSVALLLDEPVLRRLLPNGDHRRPDLLRTVLTSAKVEVHHVFSECSPHLGAQDLSQKLIWRTITLLPNGKSHDLGTRRE